MGANKIKNRRAIGDHNETNNDPNSTEENQEVEEEVNTSEINSNSTVTNKLFNNHEHADNSSSSDKMYNIDNEAETKLDETHACVFDFNDVKHIQNFNTTFLPTKLSLKLTIYAVIGIKIIYRDMSPGGDKVPKR